MENKSRGFALSVVTGVIGAFGFALLIRLFPEVFFTDPLWRVAWYVLGALTAPMFAIVWMWLAARLRWSYVAAVVGAAVGAGMFDSVALGFFPAIFGQTGDAVLWVSTGLAWGAACIGLIGYPMALRAEARREKAGA